MYILTGKIAQWKALLEQDRFNDLIHQILSDYESLGPIPGILLPFIEAFLPFLPLFVFVFANAAAYGLLEGFLLSWIGASAGSVAVFLIIRKLGNRKIFQKIQGNKQVGKVTTWVERHGFGPLFLLTCFPFSPSAVINVVAGLSKISVQQFVLAIILGKAVMIFSISYIGSSIFEFAQKPVETSLVIGGIILFWIVGKYFEKWLQKKGDSQGRVALKKD